MRLLALFAVALVALTVAPAADSQTDPDLGTVGSAMDEAAGMIVPPVLDAAYTALGQNITEEDVDLFLDLNVTKGEITPLGFLVGSGNIELQADIRIRGELHVISSDRIRAIIEGDNPYNMSAENATFLSEVFLPAEVFRATFAAEVIAAFQEDMEQSMVEFIERTVPELEIISLDVNWENTSPLLVPGDASLTEPPLVLTIDATVQYLRVESLQSLFQAYMETGDSGNDNADYVKAAKADASDPLRTRDFFAAAAYNQLLNLSMQPGWTLDVALGVPRGYSFEYVNENVEQPDDQTLAFQVDGSTASEGAPVVFIASITHRGAVAAVLLLVTVLGAVFLHAPVGLLYHRWLGSRQRKAIANGD